MPDINPSLPVVGQPDSTEEPKVVTAITQLVAAVNDIDSAMITDGVVTAEDMQAALLDKLGVSTAATVRRGKSIIATEESRTNVAFGLMATNPDRVSSVVLPTDGIIFVMYHAYFKSSVGSAGAAAIFLGASEVRDPEGALAGGVATQSGADTYSVVGSYSAGMLRGGTVAGGAPTLPQVIGAGGASTDLDAGVCMIQAAAGTYDVSIQFKASSGSVTAKNRKLWVWAEAF